MTENLNYPSAPSLKAPASLFPSLLVCGKAEKTSRSGGRRLNGGDSTGFYLSGSLTSGDQQRHTRNIQFLSGFLLCFTLRNTNMAAAERNPNPNTPLLDYGKILVPLGSTLN